MFFKKLPYQYYFGPSSVTPGPFLNMSTMLDTSVDSEFPILSKHGLHDLPQPTPLPHKLEIPKSWTTATSGITEDEVSTVASELDTNLDVKQFEEMLNVNAERMKALADLHEGKDEQRFEAKPGQEDLVRQLQDALAAGDVNLRTAIGQRFSLFLKNDPQAKEEYNSFKGQVGSQKLKQDFRLRWSKSELQKKVVVKKSKLEQLKEEFGEEGVYMSLDRFIIKEGGHNNERAVRCALNYAAVAYQKGHPWVEWHAWKRVTEILVFDKVRRNVYAKSFSLEREEVADIHEDDDGQGESPAEPERKKHRTDGQPVDPAIPEPETPAPSNAGKSKGKGKGGKGGKGKPGAPPGTPTPVDDKEAVAKKAFAAKLKKAGQLKARYLRAVAIQATIDKNIEEDSKYEWAKNDIQRLKFKQTMEPLQAKINGETFNKFLLTNEISSARQHFGESSSVLLDKFLLIDEELTCLEQAQRRFNKMHLANVS